MENYLVGIDDQNAVFVAHFSWKKSDSEVFWPPSHCKEVHRLMKNGESPGLEWDVFACKWTEYSSSKYKSLALFV